MSLFKATRAYCEQIYMLYSDPAFTAEKLIFDSASGTGEPGAPADLEISDEYNVLHRVWRLTDARLINLIVTAMADKKLIIADGHHRYETSVTYMKERAAELGHAQVTVHDENDESPSNRVDEHHAHLPVPAFPEAAMMMTFVNMDAPGITILPTHRVVFGLPDFNPEAFLAKAEEFFTVTPQDKLDLAPLAAATTVAMVAVTPIGPYLLTAKPDAIAQALTDLGISPRQAALDVVQLHNILLERILELTHESIARADNIRYIREASEAVDQVDRGEANLAFLIRPVSLEQMRDISLSGDVMPQKSTDFYPKLLSGLAIYALD
jgi:uncharacterized protein (DUF1015 family)